MPGAPMPTKVEPYGTSVWTAKDEQQFLEMQQRRERVTTKRRKVLTDAFTSLPEMIAPTEEYLDFLIRRADVIRDALEPYDSGVRAASLEDRA